MEELFANINWIAVIVGAIVAYALGALWYSPVLFGKAWMKLSGVGEPKKKGMAKSYVAGFATQLVTAFVLSAFVGTLGASTATEGAIVGFWIWLGFLATTMFGMVLWENKPVKLYLISAVQVLVALKVMGAIVAVLS